VDIRYGNTERRDNSSYVLEELVTDQHGAIHLGEMNGVKWLHAEAWEHVVAAKWDLTAFLKPNIQYWNNYPKKLHLPVGAKV
jgi:hypothetical protein